MPEEMLTGSNVNLLADGSGGPMPHHSHASGRTALSKLLPVLDLQWLAPQVLRNTPAVASPPSLPHFSALLSVFLGSPSR